MQRRGNRADSLVGVKLSSGAIGTATSPLAVERPSAYDHITPEAMRKTRARRAPRALAGVLLVYAALAVATAWTYMPWCDEAWFAGPALSLITDGHMGTPVLDSTAGWHGRNLTGIGQYTYWIMPLYPLSESLWFRLIPFGLVASRLYSVAWGVAALLAWWIIVRRLSGEAGIATLAAALIAIDFSFVSNAGAGRMDMMCAALGASGVAAFLCLRQRNLAAALVAGNALIAAATLTHPMAAGACAGLAAMAWFFDRRRIGPREIGAALIPYVVAAGCWGLYIARNPALFQMQFTGNATGRLISGPLGEWLRRQTVERFLYIFGLAPYTYGFSRLKLVILLVYLAGLAGALASRWIRVRKEYRGLLLFAAVSGVVVEVLDKEVQDFYMLYFTVPLAAILAVWAGTAWHKHLTPRWAVAGTLGAIVAVQLAVDASRIREDMYHTRYLATTRYLQQHLQPGDTVFGSAELAFQLGFSGRVVDDYRLGYLSGKRAPFIVLDRMRYTPWIDRLKDSEPAVYQQITQMLSQNYRLVHQNETYRIFQQK